MITKYESLAYYIYFKFTLQVSKRHRNNAIGVRNSKVDAIEELKQAFERIEMNCNGVCDYFVKEMVWNLTRRNLDP